MSEDVTNHAAENEERYKLGLLHWEQTRRRSVCKTLYIVDTNGTSAL